MLTIKEDSSESLKIRKLGLSNGIRLECETSSDLYKSITNLGGDDIIIHHNRKLYYFEDTDWAFQHKDMAIYYFTSRDFRVFDNKNELLKEVI